MKPDFDNWAVALQKSLARWDITLPVEMLDSFQVYLNELTQWNSMINLTALREPEHIALGHFADSLAAMTIDEVFKAQHARVIDMGTGAGFPGLPLKILNSGWHLTLLESVNKKCEFLRSVVNAIELNHVTIFNKRSEDLGHDKEHREKYDLVFSRGLAGLSTIIEYGLPFLRIGGHLVAHRGRTASDEATRVHVALEELGGEVAGVHHYEIAGLAGARAFVVVKKVKPTSKHYPRRTGIPAKRPL